MIQTETGPQKLTYAEFKARKGRRTVAHPIVTDEDAVIAYQQAAKALEDAQKRLAPTRELGPLRKARDDAEKALREATIIVRLRALPKDAYARLKAEHPPTDEDHADLAESTGGAQTKALFHTDSFGPALVAACLLEPQVTLEEAEEMAAEMNEAEWNSLFTAAILVNQTASSTAGLVFS